MRFPGLISAMTVPSGGTSDYAPEMIHAAANGEPYACFVRPDTRIPFMAMPDGVEALMRLAAAPRERLTRTAYNVAAFNPSAEEIRAIVARGVSRGDASTYDVDEKRQGIVDSWPADVDDSAARRDWGFSPAYDFVARVQRIPHPDHPEALPVNVADLPQSMTAIEIGTPGGPEVLKPRHRPMPAPAPARC